MVEVTPGAKSTSSSSFSIDAIISKDGGPVTASSPVPQFADTRLCAAQPPPTSSSSYLEHLHQRAQQQEQRAGTGGAVTGGRDIYRVQALNGDLSPTRGLVARSDGTGKSDLRGSGIDGTGSMDVLTASAPRHHMHPMSLAASSSASSALLSTSSMASQLPPHHPHFPSPSLSSPHHPSPHHPIPHHHLLGAVSDSAAASLFSAATKSPMYSSLSGLHGGPHDLGSASAAHTAGLFGQSPLSYAGMSQAAAAAEASGLSTLHALASQKSALHHAGSLHGLAAGGMTLPGVHQQFPLYSRLSWPYFHRYTGSEPSFLLPFRKPKRIRTAFSPSQLLRLEHAFEKNHYVVGQERKDLAVNLSLTETQVKVWFQNRRTKHKRLTTEEEQEKHRTSKSSPDNSRDEDDMMDD